MADLKETVASGMKVNRAAVDPTDVVRKQEHDIDMAARPTAVSVSDAIGEVTHDAVTVSDTDSVALGLSSQALTADVRVATALIIGPEGVSVDLGTGADQAAAGNHTHDNDHPPATSQNTDTATVSIDEGQVVSVDVKLDPSGSLTSTASGVRVQDNTFAAKTHSHNPVTGSTPGFMSSADKTRLDQLWNEDTQQFENTGTITWTIGSTAKATAHLGIGLKDVGNGIEVDFSDVASAGAQGGYTLTLTGAVLGSTANSTNYYVGADNGQTPSGTISAHDLIVPKSGTITRAFVKTRVGTAGSGQFVPSYLRVNDTVNTLIGSTPYNTSPAEISNIAMDLDINAGDRLALLAVTPAWVTKPTNVQWWCQLWIQ